jgi:twitching motility protein PilU
MTTELDHDQHGGLIAYLKLMALHGASDLFLSVGVAPTLKIQGAIHHLNMPPMPSDSVKGLAESIMNETQKREFERELECDFAVAIKDIGRYRINLFVQRGQVAMSVRYVKFQIPTVDQLHLPPVISQLAMEKRGLILAVGAAGAGKSTAIAAMLEYRNQHAEGHILTVEDPIEYLHKHRKCIINQREIGLDTHSYKEALSHALRESADVIMIGEIRDLDTMQHALNYADTGLLCISTLHANNAYEAIERILGFFPDEARKQVLLDLSMNLKAVIALRLIRGLQERLVPAVEVMQLTPRIADLIRRGQVDLIRDAIAKSVEPGVQTFDQSLYDLYMQGIISMNQAIENADSKTDLALRIRLTTNQNPDISSMEIQ